MDSEIFGKFENSVRHGETLKNLMISAYFSMSYSTSRVRICRRNKVNRTLYEYIRTIMNLNDIMYSFFDRLVDGTTAAAGCNLTAPLIEQQQQQDATVAAQACSNIIDYLVRCLMVFV